MKAVDTYRHKGMRRKLVQQIRKRGISDPVVLQAMEKVPRHLFLDPAFLEHAYKDQAFQIGAEQTISQPYTVAYMSEMLEVTPGLKVLEIGTGSGYQACILAEMGCHVYSIERHKVLFNKTKKLLPELGYPRIKCFFGDGFKGLKAWAPFDRIIITAAAPDVPQSLVDQLNAGGIMVLPIGHNDHQIMYKVIKNQDGSLQKIPGAAFRFVPMLPGKVYTEPGN